MSAPLCVLLTPEAVYAWPRGGTVPDAEARAGGIRWSPDAPGALLETLRTQFGVPSCVVVVVGLGFLETALPQLPPVDNARRVRMLQRDSDRYFALREPVAVATDGPVAFALPAATLAAWADAIGAWSPVRAVLSIGQVAAAAGVSGRFTVDAGAGATGWLTIADGRVQEARRVRATATADADATATDTPARRSLPLAAIADGAWRAADGPLNGQLLDAGMRAQAARQRTHRLWQAAAVTAAALVLLGASVNRWRDRQLAAMQREVTALTPLAATARDAQRRLQQAAAENRQLTAAATQRAAADAPAAVLARLGALLPRDAFVQRLEWNGREWRIDGSAADAAALVPLLDADPLFDAVTTAAPSTRFVEAGRPRSSFAIVFTTTVPTSPAGRAP